jgi:hypothetical protein
MPTWTDRAIEAMEIAESLRNDLDDLLIIRERLQELEAQLAAERAKKKTASPKPKTRKTC